MPVGSTTWFRAGRATVAVQSTVPAAARTVRTLYPAYRIRRAAAVEASATIQLRAAPGDTVEVVGAGSVTRSTGWGAALSAAEVALGQALLQGFPEYLQLHAGGVLGRHGALLLPAGSGSGKSTLVAHCCQQGWPVFGDDVVLLDPEPLRLHPFKRLLKLERDVWSLLALRQRGADAGGPWPDVALADPAAWPGGWAEPAPLAAVVIPRFEAATPLRLRTVAGGAAVLQLLAQSFNVAARGAAGIEALARLVDAVPVYELAYGSLAAAADALTTLPLQTSTTPPPRGHSAASGPK